MIKYNIYNICTLLTTFSGTSSFLFIISVLCLLLFSKIGVISALTSNLSTEGLATLSGIVKGGDVKWGTIKSSLISNGGEKLGTIKSSATLSVFVDE